MNPITVNTRGTVATPVPELLDQLDALKREVREVQIIPITPTTKPYRMFLSAAAAPSPVVVPRDEVLPVPSTDAVGLSDGEVDAIMEWLADPESLDWDHLDSIDAKGWRTD
jgi:hypothetical protein